MELFYSGDLEMENKYQEALRRIAFNYGLSALDGDTNEIMDDNFNEDMRVIKELVDTFTIIKENYYKDKLKVSMALHKLITEKELEILGEKIDWTDDNE